MISYVSSAVMVVVLAAILYGFQQSVLDLTVWIDPFPLPSLVGPYLPNDLLAKANIFCGGECVAPESMAIDPTSGNVYASLSDGTVALISEDGIVLSTVFFTGGYMTSHIDSRTNGISGFEEKLTWCRAEARAHRLAWDINGERSCGRPLGLRLKQNHLYILDAYHGLFRLDVSTNKAEHIITTETVVVTPKGAIGSSDPVVFLPPKFFNDLDLVEIPGSASWSEEGSLQKEIPDGLLIYFTDTSYKHARGQNRQEILDGAPRGRFFSYDTRNSELKVILCGLHFPNGVQVLNKNEILLVESTRFRILKVNVKNAEVPNTLLNSCAEDGSLASYLKGDKDSLPIVSVFLDAVPGFMDNIRPDSLQHVNADGTKTTRFFVGVGTKSSTPFSLLWTGYQGTLLRDFIGKLLPMKYVEKLLPKYGLVILVDHDGTVVESFHDPKGSKMKFVSEAQRHPLSGDIWMGSHSNPFIGVLKAGSSRT